MSAPLTRTADEFYLALCDSRLLSLEQMESLKAVGPRESVEGAAWVADLVERGYLTEFQAEQLLAGQSGALVFGQYRILDRLGGGGMGHVYKAEHTVMKRVVAIKVIAAHLVKDASAVARFHHEVELAARLLHPNIITAYDAAEANGLHFLVMEYVEGIDLGRLVKETGPLTVVQACEYVRQAALGLQHAHEHGLVHCDIKPANLLLRQRCASAHGAFSEPVVKILDFGLARLAGSPSESVTILSKSGTDLHFAGTPDYIAPEQALNCQAADIRSDLYSLGCTFYFLLAAQGPFPGGTWSEKILRHQFDLVPPLESVGTDVPEPVAEIVYRLLSKSPDDRFQAPAELAEALSRWLATRGRYRAELSASGTCIGSAKTRHAGDGLTEPTPDQYEDSIGCGTRFQSCRARTDTIGIVSHEDIRMAADKTYGTVPSKLRRLVSSSPFAAVVAISLGLVIAAYMRQPAEEPWHPALTLASRSQSVTNGIELGSAPGKQFRGLAGALTAARDGDTVVIHGNGPFVVAPITLQSKALTIKAAPGTRPRLELSDGSVTDSWQSLLSTDRPLTLDGLELARTDSAGAVGGATHLVYCDHASLRMVNCSLLAPQGSALVVCRKPRELDLRHCSLTAHAAAVSVEVAGDYVSEVRLADSDLVVRDSTGSAVSLWTAEARRPVAARLHLQGNHIEAGRALALAGPIQNLQADAERNEFTVHQALVSCAGAIDPRTWPEALPWRGQGNHYRGLGSALLVNGKAFELSGMSAWHESWTVTRTQALNDSPSLSFRTAVHEPPN